MLTAVLTLIPSVLLLFYVYRKDRVNKEPKKLLFMLFVFGCISVIPVFFIESYLESVLLYVPFNYTLLVLIDSFLCVALVEEAAKFLITRAVIWNHEAFDSTFDGMVYCAFESIGFATVENIMYVFTYGMDVAITRAITSMPGHFAFSIVMGLFLSRSKYYYIKQETDKTQYLSARNSLIYSLFFPVVFHGMYDFCIMQGSYILLMVFNVIILLIYLVIFRIVSAESKKDRLF